MPENGKLVLDPNLLTPRDMKRARVAISGQNPYEMMENQDDAIPLIIWCLQSRVDPDFTWEQALDTPFSDFEMAEEGPPKNEPRSSNGSKTKRGEKTQSSAKLSVVEPGSSSKNTSD
jgi:hypothetical protein